MEILIQTHSILRYVVLLLLLLAIFRAFGGWTGKKAFSPGDRKTAMFAMISTHLQLVIGLILYFTSEKVVWEGDVMGNSMSRFWAVEHIGAMVLGIALITIGYSSAKRTADPVKAHRKVALFFLSGLILILSRIPWPFMKGFEAWGWI